MNKTSLAPQERCDKNTKTWKLRKTFDPDQGCHPIVLRTCTLQKSDRGRLYFVLTVILRKAEAEHHVRKN